MIKVRLTKLGTLILTVVLLVACGTDHDKPYVEEPVEQLYNTALAKLKIGDYPAAAVAFDEVDRQLANAPRWWPSHGDADHMRRLRAAEKVMLEEEALEKTRRETAEIYARIEESRKKREEGWNDFWQGLSAVAGAATQVTAEYAEQKREIDEQLKKAEEIEQFNRAEEGFSDSSADLGETNKRATSRQSERISDDEIAASLEFLGKATGETPTDVEETNKMGFMTRPLWKPLHLQSPYLECPHAPVPVAESLATQIINIPSGVRE